MLIDLPVAPPAELPAIVSQVTAATNHAASKVPENCRVVLNTAPPGAQNSFFPVSHQIAKTLGLASQQSIAPKGFYEVTLLVPPKHGQVTPVVNGPGELTQSESPQWIYESTDKDYQGHDEAIFSVKAKGRIFQSLVTFRSIALHTSCRTLTPPENMNKSGDEWEVGARRV